MPHVVFFFGNEKRTKFYFGNCYYVLCYRFFPQPALGSEIMLDDKNLSAPNCVQISRNGAFPSIALHCAQFRVFDLTHHRQASCMPAYLCVFLNG